MNCKRGKMSKFKSDNSASAQRRSLYVLSIRGKKKRTLKFFIRDYSVI